MADKPTQTAAASPPGATADNERYRYIGFDVFPKRSPRFWESDGEAAEFKQKVDLHAGVLTLDRDFSLLQQEELTRTDRVILTVTGILLALTMAAPWVHYRTASGTDFSLGWTGALGTLAGGLGTAFGGGIALGLGALASLVLVLGGPLLGMWILASLWIKAKSPEAYEVRLRRPLKLGYVLLYAGLAVGLFALIGGRIDGFVNWGLIDPGETFGLETLVTMASYGPYAVVAMGLVAGVKSGDL